jgi:RNA polymerase sigma factor (sigma-70 family)
LKPQPENNVSARLPVTAQSDADLARLWLGGEVTAYNELVSRHLDPVHRYVSSRCGDASGADDVCQEVFLEVCLKISNYDPQYPFTAWLFMIARRKVVDRFRRLKPMVEFNPESHGGQDFSHPSQILEERESARNAWEKVFKILPEPQATALWLRVQGRMSVIQISTTMSQSEANVKVLLFRARQHLVREWKRQPLTTLHESTRSTL